MSSRVFIPEDLNNGFRPLRHELDPEAPGGDLSENPIHSYAAVTSYTPLVGMEG